MPTVDVVIPCIPNHFKYLTECVESLFLQTTLPQYIYIAASSTSDAEGQLLEKNLRQKFFSERIRVLSTEEKLYAGGNRNRGARASTADVICFVDADDITHPTKIQKVLETFDREPHVSFVLHGYAITNENRVCKESNSDELDEIAKKKKKSGFALCHPNVTHGHISVKKSVTEKVHQTGNKRGEDTKYVRDLLRAGFKGYIIGENLVTYRPENSSNASLATKSFVLSKLRKLRKYKFELLLCFLLTITVIGIVVSAIFNKYVVMWTLIAVCILLLGMIVGFIRVKSYFA